MMEVHEKSTDETQAHQVPLMDFDNAQKIPNARPLAEESHGQSDRTLEEIYQEMRQKELDILLRAGFPDEKREIHNGCVETTRGEQQTAEKNQHPPADASFLEKSLTQEKTCSQPELTIEEVFQEIRQKEIDILLRAGFPGTESRGLSSRSDITETETKLSTSDTRDSTPSSDVTSSNTRSLVNNKAPDQHELVDITEACEMDQEDSVTSFTHALFCYPCCYRKRAPMAYIKKQNGETSERRPGLFKRFRNFMQRIFLRRGRA